MVVNHFNKLRQFRVNKGFGYFCHIALLNLQNPKFMADAVDKVSAKVSDSVDSSPAENTSKK